MSATADTLTLVSVPDADTLRSRLDALNEAGEAPIVVGIDDVGAPFLITLVGPYVEGEDVIFDSPWQSDCDYGERVNGVWVPLPARCSECNAHAHGIEHLRFPVTVAAVLGRPSCSCGKPFAEDGGREGVCECCSGCTA